MIMKYIKTLLLIPFAFLGICFAILTILRENKEKIELCEECKCEESNLGNLRKSISENDILEAIEKSFINAHKTERESENSHEPQAWNFRSDNENNSSNNENMFKESEKSKENDAREDLEKTFDQQKCSLNINDRLERTENRPVFPINSTEEKNEDAELQYCLNVLDDVAQEIANGDYKFERKNSEKENENRIEALHFNEEAQFFSDNLKADQKLIELHKPEEQTEKVELERKKSVESQNVSSNPANGSNPDKKPLNDSELIDFEIKKAFNGIVGLPSIERKDPSVKSNKEQALTDRGEKKESSQTSSSEAKCLPDTNYFLQSQEKNEKSKKHEYSLKLQVPIATIHFYALEHEKLLKHYEKTRDFNHESKKGEINLFSLIFENLSNEFTELKNVENVLRFLLKSFKLPNLIEKCNVDSIEMKYLKKVVLNLQYRYEICELLDRSMYHAAGILSTWLFNNHKLDLTDPTRILETIVFKLLIHENISKSKDLEIRYPLCEGDCSIYKIKNILNSSKNQANPKNIRIKPTRFIYLKSTDAESEYFHDLEIGKGLKIKGKKYILCSILLKKGDQTMIFQPHPLYLNTFEQFEEVFGGEKDLRVVLISYEMFN